MTHMPLNHEFFKDAINLEIRTPDEDIRKYVEDTIKSTQWTRLITGNPELRDAIVNETVRKSDGMFLYTRLFLEWITSHHALSVSTVKQHLLSQPSLYGVYQRMLERLVHQSQYDTKVAFEVLTWLSFSQRPLSTNELQAALAIQAGDCDLDKDKKMPIESLITSLQLFLQEQLPQQPDRLVDNPHTLIAKKCLSYLNLKPFFSDKIPRVIGELDERLRQYPLLRYAAMHWGHHAAKGDLEDLLSLVMSFFESYHATSAASLIMSSFEKHPKHYKEAYTEMQGLHIASSFGLSTVVSNLIHKRGASPIVKTDGEWTALHWAARRGYVDVVSLLLETPSTNAHVDMRTKLDAWTPLHLAAKEGYTSIGADPDRKNIHGMTALHCATKAGNLDLVQEIINDCHQRTADLNIVDTLGLTALDEAIRKKHKPIEQILRAQGATMGQTATLGPAFLEPKIPGIIHDLPTDFAWKSYEVDEELSSRIKNGAQCLCHVLKKGGSTQRPVMRVFRKTFEVEKDAEGEIRKYPLTERQILYYLWHPHIVAYLDSDSDPERNAFLLYMEFDDPPPSNCQPLHGVEVWSLTWQLSAALAYLHYGLALRYNDDDGFKASFGRSWEYILHRDVKPANVVIQSIADENRIFKLCDLGIAAQAGKGLGYNRTQYIGSTGLEPPEVREGDKWTTKGDIYCLGKTIRLTAKMKDKLMDSESLRKFLKKRRR
ncbi:hypothetical protein NM208_g4588 [Fusarium decemcellulare]|uniref:Uncharacterized protein n=1 Tax=Fusarium decemcellulare TaxID=57161 RepID=A0ACC1SK67_9HYPO|nr:hypothetical protein NM208_g4588 [Fusarium decemcellulare]